MSARADRLQRPIQRLSYEQAEAAAALGMSVDHFDRHVKPHVPVVYSGAKRLYPVRGLEQWLAEQAERPGRRRA